MPNLEIALPAIKLLRGSEEREAMHRLCNLSDQELEERLAAGDARKQVLRASSAYVFETLPRILATVVAHGLEGNLTACKIILEIAGLEESLRETVAALTQAEAAPSLEMEFLQTLRSRVETMPENPDPLNMS